MTVSMASGTVGLTNHESVTSLLYKSATRCQRLLVIPKSRPVRMKQNGFRNSTTSPVRFLKGFNLVAQEDRCPGRRHISARADRNKQKDPNAARLFPPHSPSATKADVPAGASRRPANEVATRFIDDRILEIVANPTLGVRQAVLVTGGFDSRPYRLPWPPQTLLFDISPPVPNNEWLEGLKAGGAKVPRGTLLRHVSADMALREEGREEGWGEELEGKGYQSTRSSVWVLQGLDGLLPAGLQSVLGHVSSLAMKGTLVVGEVPRGALLGQENLNCTEEEAEERADAAFGANGFEVHLHSLAEVAAGQGRSIREVAPGGDLLFTATQRRLSDGQVEMVRSEMSRAEEEGDEMGFEDNP